MKPVVSTAVAVRGTMKLIASLIAGCLLATEALAGQSVSPERMKAAVIGAELAQEHLPALQQMIRARAAELQKAFVGH
jgi:hypothetical protein